MGQDVEHSELVYAFEKPEEIVVLVAGGAGLYSVAYFRLELVGYKRHLR